MIKTFVIAAAMLCFAGAANAAPFYLKAEIGTADVAVEGINLDDGQTYGAAVGTSVGPVRVEAGVRHVDTGLDLFGVSADGLDYAATAYFDFAITERTGVFVGAGVDYITAEASIGPWAAFDAEGTGYHYAAGVAHRVSDNAILEAQYRHTEADLDGLDLELDAVTIGARFAL